MFFDILLIIMASYITYNRGTDFLLRSRLLADRKAERIAYIFFLLSGIILGECIGISLTYHYYPTKLPYQMISGTLCSIFIGEAFFEYNRRMVQRIPTMQERKNY